MAIAACSARPPRTAASSSSNAIGSWLMTSIAPSGPASPMIGAAIRSRTFDELGQRIGQIVVLELGRG